MIKKLILIAFVTAVCMGMYLASTTVDSSTPVATASKKTYSATLYIAGMGGHFAKADVIIDPNNADDPIKVTALDKVDIGDKTTHPTHDPRIDSNDSSKLFWSTYKLDPDGNVRVGVTDLKSGKIIKEKALKVDEKAKWTGALYCASGQTKKMYMPVTMTDEAYIDVFDKETLELKHRVFLDYKAGETKFYHGTNSPDMKTFIVAVNRKEDGKGNGKVDFLLLDLPALEKGEAKVIARKTHTGEPDKTLTFRGYFTPDGKYITQSAGDRLWVLDAKTLDLVDEKMIDGQVHDAMPTPDGKYAVLTVRNVADGCDIDGKTIPGKSITDGTIQMYDVDAKLVFGKQVSTCQACHKGFGLGDKNAVLCGVDGTWN